MRNWSMEAKIEALERERERLIAELATAHVVRVRWRVDGIDVLDKGAGVELIEITPDEEHIWAKGIKVSDGRVEYMDGCWTGRDHYNKKGK
jgi:hypothetical protein